MKPTAKARFWRNIEDASDPHACWLFTIGRCRDGYTQMRVDGILTMAHRFAYEFLIGEIPDGMELDHTCHNLDSCTGGPCEHRRCVNPAHLEPVTPRVNTLRSFNPAAINARKTRCKNGHEFDGILGRRRLCNTCRDERRAPQAA